MQFKVTPVIEHVATWAGWFSAWLIAAMALLVFVEVVMRYAASQPLMVADEFAGYMLVAIAYLGVARTWREKGHPRITALVNILSPKLSTWLRLITRFLVLAFMVILCLTSYGYVADTLRLGLASASWLRVPLVGPHMFLPIGFTLLALLVVVDLFQDIKAISVGSSTEGMGP